MWLEEKRDGPERETYWNSLQTIIIGISFGWCLIMNGGSNPANHLQVYNQADEMNVSEFNIQRPFLIKKRDLQSMTSNTNAFLSLPVNPADST